MNSLMLKWCVTIVLTIVSFMPAFSQDLLNGSKIWTGFTFTYKVSDKVDVGYEHVHSIEARDFDFSFSQGKLFGQYQFNKKFSIGGAYSYMLLPWNGGDNQFSYHPNVFGSRTVNNLAINGTHRFRLGNKFHFKQRIIPQYFFPLVDKFRLRLNYRMKAYYRADLPLDIVPNVELGVYYYHGGIQVGYQDQTGGYSYYSPNGIHRFRMKTAIMLTPMEKWKRLKLIVFYQYQRELNLIGRDINIRNNLGEIILPFNNYTAFGVHVLYTLKHY